MGLLGPLRVTHGQSEITVPARRQRALLAVLLTRANQVVSLDRLADLAWDEDPPPGARATVRSYIKRLRQVLGPEVGGRIGTRDPGYVIEVADGELDVLRFGSLCEQGRTAVREGGWERGFGLFGQALSLWRGVPLADIQAASLRAEEVPRLEELRLQALEWRCDAALQLRRHDELLPELRSLTGRHPLRERFHAQFMLALAGSGRQAEALAAYQRARQLLAEEIGVEPGPGLREVHEYILRADPAAARPVTVSTGQLVTGTAPLAGLTLADASQVRAPAPPVQAPQVQASRASRLAGWQLEAPETGVPTAECPPAHHPPAQVGPGRVQPAQVPAAQVPAQHPLAQGAPRQLPAAPAGFTGRQAALRALAAQLGHGGGTVAVTVVSGTAGVGKTALASHWAHSVADRFPDGQLHASLRGFGPASDPPVPAADVLRGFLTALGVPPERIPAGTDDLAAAYRSALAGKRVLVVLDNARDEAQVRPLLPGHPGCFVLVTSRSQLTGLLVAEGAQPLTLDVLSQADAAELMARRLGADRAEAEPAAVTELVELSARLPLALAIAAARAGGRAGLPLAALAEELRDARGRLDALDAGDPATSVRTAFSWSCAQLSEPAAAMFRLLSLPPGPDVPAAAAASLAGLPLPQARRALRELARFHLLAEPAPGRYACHDLLRAYAAEQCHARTGEAQRRAAIHRLLDYYLHTGRAADALLDPGREPFPPETRLPGAAPSGPGALPETPEGPGALPDAPGTPADPPGTPPHPPGCGSCPATGAEAMAWFQAEHACVLPVIQLAAEEGFAQHAWQIPWTLVTFLERQGHWHDWAATQRTALMAARATGNLAAQAQAHFNIGRASVCLGDHGDGHAGLDQALRIFARLGDLPGQARTEMSIARAFAAQGRPVEALARGQRSLALFRSGQHEGQAGALNSVGWYHAVLGDYQQARSCCEQALELFRRIGHRGGEAHTWDSLGYANHHLGRHTRALDCYQRAARLFDEIGDHYKQAQTLSHLGDTHEATGDSAAARAAWRQAVTILERLRHPAAHELRAKLDTATAASR